MQRKPPLIIIPHTQKGCFFPFVLCYFILLLSAAIWTRMAERHSVARHRIPRGQLRLRPDGADHGLCGGSHLRRALQQRCHHRAMGGRPQHGRLDWTTPRLSVFRCYRRGPSLALQDSLMPTTPSFVRWLLSEKATPIAGVPGRGLAAGFWPVSESTAANLPTADQASA